MTEALLRRPNPPRDEAPSPDAIRVVWWAAGARFLVHGLVVSTWVSRIPAVQGSLGLSNGALGMCLLGTAAGSVLGIPCSGFLVSRYGSRRVVTWSTLVFCFTLVMPALSVNAATLFAGLMIFGALGGINDVAMNSLGVAVESRLGSPTMSRFHAMFSLGGMIGSGLGGLVAARQIPTLLHFGAAGLCFAILTAVTAPLILNTDPSGKKRDHRLQLRRMPRVLLFLSAIAFCILISEGALADWTGVYLKQVLKTGPGLAATGYAVFSAAMAIFRMVGDRITLHLGPVRTVRAGSVVATLGILAVLAAPSAYWTFPGLAAAGAGYSVIIPLVFGAGGRVNGVDSGVGIATVTGIGYTGFLFGPPAIGFVAQIATLRWGLGIVVGLSVLTAILADAVGQAGRHVVDQHPMRHPAP